MKYIVATEGKICSQLSEPLIQEISRFDIRGEIRYIESNKNDLKRELKKFTPDVLIVVGSTRSRAVLQTARNREIKSCFFYISLLDNKPFAKTPTLSNGRFFQDFSLTDEESGSLLFDFIRKISTNDGTSIEREKPIVSIVGDTSVYQIITRLKRSLSSIASNIDFQLIDVSKNLELAIKEISNSNGMIAANHLSNMLGVLCNCPLMNVYNQSLFTRAGQKQSVINLMMEKDVVKSYPTLKISLIKSELDLILNDHQYSAGIMDDFQMLKSKLGTRPFARNVGKELVEWLEE